MDTKVISEILQSCCSKDETWQYLLLPTVRCKEIGYGCVYATDGIVAVEVNLGNIKPADLGIKLHMTKNNPSYENVTDIIARRLDTIAVRGVRSTVSICELSDFCEKLIERVHRERGEFERDEDDPKDFEPIDTAHLYGRVMIGGEMFDVTQLVKVVGALKSIGVDECEMSRDTQSVGFYGNGLRCVCMGMRAPYGIIERDLIVEEFKVREGR